MSYTQQPVPIQGQVNNPTTALPDTSIINLTCGKSGELLTADLHGKYYTQNYRGNVFHGTTAAAAVLIPVSGTTGATFGIWNPAGNTKNVIMLVAYYGWISTTGAPANIGYDFLTGAGSAIGTAAPLSAFTAGTAQSGKLGSGIASSVFFTPSAATLTAAGTYLGSAGMSQLTTTGASTATPMFTLREDFDGSIIIPPGTFMFPTSANTAELSKFDIRWVWAEFPI